MFDFPALTQALIDWPAPINHTTNNVASPILGRLLQILEKARSGPFESKLDFIVLIRQLLLSRSNERRLEKLSVPQGSGWPDAETWKKFGFVVTNLGTRFLLQPEPWSPDWLGGKPEAQQDIFADEHQEQMVRRDASIPMDPFLDEVTKFNSYVCPGQREAVLSALFMPAGTSLIVHLPTGSGKSLVAQAPFLVQGPEAGLTLFIVPTIALGLDLERRTHEMLKGIHPNRERHRLVWIGGQSDGSNDQIKQRIRSGSQGILFASPEAVCGSLLHSLYDAADKGLISYLAIDEAHLIAQWGDNFRPAFQLLSGVRRGLLDACPNDGFRTLLLSATFSPQVLETLSVLFGPSDKLQMVSAVHLRPEPRYFSYETMCPEDKKERVKELLRYIPRPFILYTTKREDARSWFKNLKDEGCRRIACVHGKTPNDERERIIQAWVEDRLDGIVATSAFGVGMDKADVRSVIHAALPETLDRFYQETGRGGRDGHACLSVTLFDSKDIRVAEGMTKPTLIGDERGYERWTTLYRAADIDNRDSDLRYVDLRLLPSGLTAETDYNRDWNMRTLILLARAGLIQLESIRPKQITPQEGEDDNAFQSRLEQEMEEYFSKVPVRSLDPQLMNRDYFARQVEEVRTRSADAAAQAFNRMLEALRGKREMSEVLLELFASQGVLVSPACRGCPASGSVPHEDGGSYQIPPGIGITRITPHDNKNWQQWFPHINPSLVVILCPANGSDASLIQALKVAVASLGIREVVMPSALRSDPQLLNLHRSTPGQLLVLRDFDDVPVAPDTLPLARATVLMPWSDKPFPRDLLIIDRPLHLVFAPIDIRDISLPHRLYRDTAQNCIELSEFLRRATQ